MLPGFGTLPIFFCSLETSFSMEVLKYLRKESDLQKIKMDESNWIKKEFEKSNIDESRVENLQYQNIANIISKLNENPKMDYTSSHKREKGIEFFECHTCKKLCLSKGKLIEHLKQHEMEIHKCSQCERAFVSKHALSYHMKSHDGVKYECDICYRMFNDKSNMKKHKNIHLNIKKYKCSLCPKLFSDPSSFKVHEEKHKGVRFKCEICDKSYSTRQTLKIHVKTNHLKIKPSFNCDTCSISFQSLQERLEHKNKDHLDIKFECYICQKMFYVKSQIKAHIVTHPEMHIKCKICGKSFDSHEKYRVHEMYHSDFMKCPYCFKLYKGGKVKLNIHIKKYHTKPKYCTVCGKLIGDHRNLKLHMLRHSGIKAQREKKPSIKELEVKGPKYQCHTCKRFFYSKTHIAEHVGNTHFQTDPIPCDICDYVSYSSPTRNRHKRDHPIMNYSCKYCAELYKDHKTFKDHLENHKETKSKSPDDWKQHVNEFIQTKGFKCNVCGLSLTKRKGLLIHLKLRHYGVASKCEICERVFPNLRYLRAHMKVHDGIEYQCSTCNNTFDTMEGLRVHVRRHVNNKSKSLRSLRHTIHVPIQQV